jgi:ubiquinone/menaquinone biosynthesis C-methylase UbiE
MAGWFRKGLPRHHTALAMIGAKSGDDVVILGASDPDLAAEVSRVTGLNGSTTVCDEGDDARARVEAAARNAGTLVEFLEGPVATGSLGDASRDLAVLMRSSTATTGTTLAASLAEAMRILRPSGRMIVIDGAAPTGLFRSTNGQSRLPLDEVLAQLERAGARAKRQLAEVDGVAYYEARKPGTP